MAVLTRLDHLPGDLLERPAKELARVLPGPTLIHLSGRREPALFVAVLLHGNEDTGWLAIREVLRRQGGRDLPRALSLFVGNVAAAAAGVRRLAGQVDYNRVWPGAADPDLPESAMMAQVVNEMRQRGVFASVDIHNNTGRNPHYACVTRLEPSFLHLARLFSRTVVYFTRPLGVQSAAFAALCPAVTVECGKPSEPHGTEHAANFVEACLHLNEFPVQPLAAADLDLYHTVATVRVPDHVSFGFGEAGRDIDFLADLDYLNFQELEAGAEFGRVGGRRTDYLRVTDEAGREVTTRLFHWGDGRLRLGKRLMPSMLTRDERVIRQDCLCYLMERLPYPAAD